MIRFTPNPIHVQYWIRCANANYEEGSNEDAKKHEYDYLVSSTKAPLAYLDNLSLTNTFFSQAEIDLDNNQLPL